MLPDKMSNYLPTEHKLNKLRLAIDTFRIGGDKGPLWITKKPTPEEHSALIREACANT